jgi:GNAT superfamily N-acetyltransferase
MGTMARVRLEGTEPAPSFSHELAIRPVSAADATAILRLRSSSLRTLAAPYYSTAQLDGLEATGALPVDVIEAGRYFVAETQGWVVGAGGWSPGTPAESMPCFLGTRDEEERASDPGIATVRAVFVDPDWAGRGVGRLIMARVEAEAAGAGRHALELLALIGAVRFYHRLGYRDLAILDLALTGGATLPSIHMRKMLPLELPAAPGQDASPLGAPGFLRRSGSGPTRSPPASPSRHRSPERRRSRGSRPRSTPRRRARRSPAARP